MIREYITEWPGDTSKRWNPALFLSVQSIGGIRASVWFEDSCKHYHEAGVDSGLTLDHSKYSLQANLLAILNILNLCMTRLLGFYSSPVAMGFSA
jgi:hypothetical protein